ncbi:hypothetical protein [Selenomonas sp. oral taxon 137]|uniref:hypothetical protein n=1 Tax=Selenomonas sp. oral taxon 137 TaxID=712531 RepID=UPI0011121295|nr:hypothetical protein [Selenomonas sp. oral taxon 137]
MIAVQGRISCRGANDARVRYAVNATAPHRPAVDHAPGSSAARRHRMFPYVSDARRPCGEC